MYVGTMYAQTNAYLSLFLPTYLPSRPLITANQYQFLHLAHTLTFIILIQTRFELLQRSPFYPKQNIMQEI